MRRKEERSKQGQINNKAKQQSTPKAVTFRKKNELPRVGLEPKYMCVSVSVCVSVCVCVCVSVHERKLLTLRSSEPTDTWYGFFM